MGSARSRYGRRIISFIFVLAVAVTSVAATGDSFYSVSADTKAVSSDRSTGNWSAFDYGENGASSYSTHYITNNEDFWQYSNHSIARGFTNLWLKLDSMSSYSSAINTKLTTTNSSLSTINTSIGSLLSSMWGTASSPVVVWRMNDNWDGNFNAQSVYTVADILGLDSINNMYAAYWTKLNNDALWSVQSGVTTLNSTVSSASSIAHTDSTSLLGKVFDSDVPSENYGFYHYANGAYNSVVNPSFIAVTGNGYRPATSSEVGSVSSLGDYLDLISRDLISQGNMLFNFSQSYTQSRYNLSSQSSSNYTVRSLADMLTYGFSDLSNFTGRLATIFASDDDIQAREDADPQIQQAQDDFISPDGAASVKLRDMGSAKDVSSSLQGTLDTGVSPATAFSYFGSNGGLFSFFSDDCKYNLDSVPETRSSEEYIDFYTPNFRQIGVAFDG